MRAPPDGYTLLIVGATNAVNATPYAPEVGFACGLTAGVPAAFPHRPSGHRALGENARHRVLPGHDSLADRFRTLCDGHHILKGRLLLISVPSHSWMEAIMPSSISKFVMVTVAIGVAVVGASAIGIAAAQSSHEQAKTTTHRIMATVLKTEFRIGDHQQLRKIFLGGDRLR